MWEEILEWSNVLPVMPFAYLFCGVPGFVKLYEFLGRVETNEMPNSLHGWVQHPKGGVVGR